MAGKATWEETQTVRRPPPSRSAGMPTVSTSRPSNSCSRNLTVPSGEDTRLCSMERPLRTPRARSCSLQSFGIYAPSNHHAISSSNTTSDVTNTNPVVVPVPLCQTV